jgi:hypothetical protein
MHEAHRDYPLWRLQRSAFGVTITPWCNPLTFFGDCGPQSHPVTSPRVLLNRKQHLGELGLRGDSQSRFFLRCVDPSPVFSVTHTG